MKKIVVKDSYGNAYTLEFTRDTVMQMERNGFKLDNPGAMPMTTIKMMWDGAFLANHKNTKPDTIDAIFAGQKDKAGLVEKLAELYQEPFETLMEDPEEGNAMWETNW